MRSTASSLWMGELSLNPRLILTNWIKSLESRSKEINVTYHCILCSQTTHCCGTWNASSKPVVTNERGRQDDGAAIESMTDEEWLRATGEVEAEERPSEGTWHLSSNSWRGSCRTDLSLCPSKEQKAEAVGITSRMLVSSRSNRSWLLTC